MTDTSLLFLTGRKAMPSGTCPQYQKVRLLRGEIQSRTRDLSSLHLSYADPSQTRRDALRGRLFTTGSGFLKSLFEPSYLGVVNGRAIRILTRWLFQRSI